jgi:hypothetical protein
MQHQGDLMMEATSTSEMLVKFHQNAQRYNSKDSHLQMNPVHTLRYTMIKEILNQNHRRFYLLAKIMLAQIHTNTKTIHLHTILSLENQSNFTKYMEFYLS